MYIVIICNHQGYKTEIGPFSLEDATALAKKWLQADPFSRAQVVRPGHKARRLTWLYGPLVNSQPYGENAGNE